MTIQELSTYGLDFDEFIRDYSLVNKMVIPTTLQANNKLFYDVEDKNIQIETFRLIGSNAFGALDINTYFVPSKLKSTSWEAWKKKVGHHNAELFKKAFYCEIRTRMLAETFPELANMTTSQINTINVNGGGVSLIFTQDLLSKEAMSYLDQSTFDKVAELIKIRDTNLDDIFAEIDLANVDIKDFDIKADVNHYRKSEINDKLANKANTNLDNVAQTDFDNLANVNHFTKTETNTLLAEKGNIDLSNIPTFQNAISNNSANDLTIDENGKIFHTGGGSVGNVGIFTTQSYLTSAVDAISIIQINTLNWGIADIPERNPELGDVVIFQQNNATNGFNPTTLGTITKISDSTVTTTTITPPKYVLQIYDVQVSSAGIKWNNSDQFGMAYNYIDIYPLNTTTDGGLYLSTGSIWKIDSSGINFSRNTDSYQFFRAKTGASIPIMVKRFYNTKLVDNTNYSQTYKTLQDESGYIYSFTISYSGGSETPFAMGSFKIEVNKFDNQIGQEYVSFIRLDGGTQFEGDPFPLRLIGYKT